jgi:hypothetical protein
MKILGKWFTEYLFGQLLSRDWDQKAVHQLVCFDLGGSSGQHGRQEAESGAAKGTRKQSRGRQWALAGSRAGGVDRCQEVESRAASATAEERAMVAQRQISADRRHTLWNPPGSRVLRHGTVCYIGRRSLVLAILKWPTSNISIFGVGYLYTAGTYDYWYRLY